MTKQAMPGHTPFKWKKKLGFTVSSAAGNGCKHNQNHNDEHGSPSLFQNDQNWEFKSRKATLLDWKKHIQKILSYERKIVAKMNEKYPDFFSLINFVNSNWTT